MTILVDSQSGSSVESCYSDAGQMRKLKSANREIYKVLRVSKDVDRLTSEEQRAMGEILIKAFPHLQENLDSLVMLMGFAHNQFKKNQIKIRQKSGKGGVK